MNIVILTSSISDKLAAAVLLRLKAKGNNVSIMVKQRCSIKNIKTTIKRNGLKKTFAKLFNKLISQKAYKNNNLYTGLNDYCKDLGYNPFITLKEVIKNSNIPCKFVRDITAEKSLSYLRTIHPDIIIPLGIGIIRDNLLEIPEIGILNHHMGLLPKYKGMNVLEWSLFHNDPIGVTIHFIDAGIDTGDILLQRNIPIETDDTIASLRAKSIPISVEGFAEVIEKLSEDAIQPIKQTAGEGKQYFVMHKRLKDFTEKRLQESIKGQMLEEGAYT